MGLKWLRDRTDSANLVAMYSTEGQPGNWNFFGNDFKNHVPDSNKVTLVLLARKFGEATRWVQ